MNEHNNLKPFYFAFYTKFINQHVNNHVISINYKKNIRLFKLHL